MLWRDPTRLSQVTHTEDVPERPGVTEDWPRWVAPELVTRLREAGIAAPWSHQVAAAELAWSGQDVIVATGTASGKSLAFQLPGLSAVLGGAGGAATMLYLAPTKALAEDQRRLLDGLRLPGLYAATYDGDTPTAERAWARQHANVVLTNPDMLHHGVLPGHASWRRFLRRLSLVVIDEVHHYRGVLGSHVAHLVRRLRRICARYRPDDPGPTFVLASATTAAPQECAQRIVGRAVRAVTTDGAPHGRMEFALVEPAPMREQPPASPDSAPEGALDGDAPTVQNPQSPQSPPVRRSATAEAADILATFVAAGLRTLTFVRSRQGAEAVALSAQRHLSDRGQSHRGQRVAAYRAGYLAQDRRYLEYALREGELVGVATTNALELGMDITGLDAVIIAGWPGTLASLWQQAGRAGRAGQHAVTVFVAREDPLDTYLVHHPEAIFGRPVEACVLDPDNPYVLGPHLCAAAAELPLTEADLELFGPESGRVLERLTEQGMLRRRPRGWFWTSSQRATDLASIRGGEGAQLHIVEAETGQLLGTVDASAAHTSVHPGAVHLHQGNTYLVRELDLDGQVALVTEMEVHYRTWAREDTELAIQGVHQTVSWQGATVNLGAVQVRRRVVGYVQRDGRTGAVLGEHRLTLPERTLDTKAVWWTIPQDTEQRLARTGVDLRGAAHAAEHAAIGLLPLFATCDRWDIGGVSTVAHPDTGRLSVFVYDGHAGGAGFAERGYSAAREWLVATREAIVACPCPDGCPSCVQSPKCGSGNEPLSKHGAVQLLDALLPQS
ncbi:DEAD/DEAH box helicase [Lipingzhangella sp. LS1_29]|uniref:DEAD/DEAH box helicase n=1 Tax=Lipingzhangella rawalii TaxID=2055835 RepID=A0ABU2H591_9ACTN|nr:DEAD/DEAH box helicase [Lipingzhangella rawalii]MDS1270015.1 DEAD/DEAH box helicase [Lipingzhangella rawalii]